LENEELQQTIGKNIKKLALPNATKDIVEEIVKLINRS
jgi:UDP-N-acetylglucosamine--N-acetylmuramyl-(pentapeptide) pyrophosphoryl-undecaprenol N-acetylglucosamine transferase